MYVRVARQEPELPKVPALCVAAAPYKGCALAPLRGYPLFNALSLSDSLWEVLLVLCRAALVDTLGAVLG